MSVILLSGKRPAVQSRLPDWLSQYVGWASRVSNQTPEIFHLGKGIWMAAVDIARRLYVDTRWGVMIFPNLCMMFIADTTFYRKTTAYKLGEQILTTAIPHLLMPTPSSPECFQDALAGHTPADFDRLPQEHQVNVLEAMRFAAQRGLFKDEIAGLFGAFNRDYMAGLKDFMLEIYDCPDTIAKEIQPRGALSQAIREALRRGLAVKSQIELQAPDYEYIRQIVADELVRSLAGPRFQTPSANDDINVSDAEDQYGARLDQMLGGLSPNTDLDNRQPLGHNCQSA